MQRPRGNCHSRSHFLDIQRLVQVLAQAGHQTFCQAARRRLLGQQLGAELALSAGAAQVHHQALGYPQGKLAAVIFFDQAQAQVHASGNTRRAIEAFVSYEERVFQHPQTRKQALQ